MPDPAQNIAPQVTGPPEHSVLQVLWITLTLNILGACLKLAVSLLSANLTVLSDAMHGFLDAANNIVGIIAIKVSWRPPDANHPYGHRKFEALASLAIGALMTLTSWEILKAIFHRLRARPATPTDSLTFLTVVAFGLVINVFISQFEMRRGRALHSTFLMADSLHIKSDILVTLVSIFSLVFAPRNPILDAVFSLIVVGFILHTGWKVVWDSILMLTDAVQMDAEPIRNVVESVAGVENCHAIRTRGMPGAIQLDLHIVVRPDLTADQTHAIETQVSQKLHCVFPDVVDVAIHHQTHLPVTAQPFR